MGSSETPSVFSIQATSISWSKCPMLQTMTLSFIASMCSPWTTSRQPVAVTKMSPTGAASSIVVTS